MTSISETSPVPEASPQPHPASWRAVALASAAYLALGLAASLATARPTTPRAVLVAVAVVAGVAFVVVAVALVAAIVRLPLTARAQFAATVGFGLVCAGARFGERHAAPGVGHESLQLVGDLLLFVAGTFFGALVSRIIKEPNIMVPVAVVAAIVDTVGVYWGFVAEVAKRAPKVVEHLSGAVPAAAKTQMPLLSAVGIGDFLFMGLFVAAIYRLGMNWRGTLWALLAAFFVVPAVFAVFPGLSALPGLVFVGIAVLAVNRKYFRFSRAEKFAMLYALVAVVAIVALGLLAGRALR